MPIADVDTGLHALAGQSAAFDAVAEFAAQYLVYAAVAVFALLWLRPPALRAGVAAAAGAVAGLALGGLLGALWDRPRPFVADHYAPLVTHPADASFPSDHLIALGALTAGAWLCWRVIGSVLALLAALLAGARAITGIHYLSDLAAGFAIGALPAVLTWYAVAPALPVLDAIDARLVRLHLRPGRRATPSGAKRRPYG